MITTAGFTCKDNLPTFKCECGKTYSHQASLYNHKTYNCNKEPQFSCPFCPMKTHRKGNLKTHLVIRHRGRLNNRSSSTESPMIVNSKIGNTLTQL